jgi:hypothetical protein
MDEDALQDAGGTEHLLLEDDSPFSQERSGINGVAFQRFREQLSAMRGETGHKTDVDPLPAQRRHSAKQDVRRQALEPKQLTVAAAALPLQDYGRILHLRTVLLIPLESSAASS